METTRVYRDSIRYIMVSYRDYRVYCTEVMQGLSRTTTGNSGRYSRSVLTYPRQSHDTKRSERNKAAGYCFHQLRLRSPIT